MRSASIRDVETVRLETRGKIRIVSVVARGSVEKVCTKIRSEG